MTKIRKPRQIFDNWLYEKWWKQILWVLIVTVLTFVIFAFLITTVFDFNTAADMGLEAEGSPSVWWILYYFFADPGCQMSIQGNSLIRVGGFIMSILGSVLLSGILISTITNVFQRGADEWRAGFSYYKLKNHIVIIGSDQMVYGLVNQICENFDNSVVVVTSKDVEQMRNSLRATLKNKKNKSHILVNYGLRDSEDYLYNINVAYAKEVYILGDSSEFDDIENYHDSLNVQCLTLIAKQCKKANRTKLPCHVLFDYKTTYYVFQYADLSSDITDYIDFHPFNFHDLWARKVFVSGHSKEDDILYKPLDYIPITQKDSEQYVHLIIIGMSKMGQAMAIQAAHIAHFPNYKKHKTRITFIDRNGKMEMGEFKQKCGELFKVSRSAYIDADAWCKAEELNLETDSIENEERYTTHYGIAEEYAHLADTDNKEFIDIEWTFIKGEDHNPVVQRLLTRYIAEKNAIITVAVCLNLTHVSLRSAMHLPKAYYEQDVPVPILVQQRKTSTMALTLNGNGFDDAKRKRLLYKNIYPFGMVYDCYDLHMAALVEVCKKRIAAVYDYFFKYALPPVKIDPDYANRIWNDTAITKRWSNVFAAASIPTKLRCIGIDWNMHQKGVLPNLTEQQVEMLAEIEHNRWNVEKLLLGYSPVNKERDVEIDADKSRKDYWKDRYVHYDIRPFDGLKADSQGLKANVYDEVIVKSLPIILNYDSGPSE